MSGLSRRDVDFLLYEWLGAHELAGRARYADHDRGTFDAVLDLAERVADDVFAPINRLLDTDEPWIDQDGHVVQPAELLAALDVYRDTGLTASTFDHEHGGAQLPYTVRSAASAFFQAGSVAAFAYPFLSEGGANLLVAHGTPDQVATYAIPMIEGRWYGTMCLSEPQSGSSLGGISTMAVPQADGSHRLTGSKMWISGGDHELTENIVHLVLARTPGAPPGTKGLSLFVVPRQLVLDDGVLGERNDVVLVGLNHKLGYRGTTNTLLGFGEGAWTPGGRAGAVGFLVGEVGYGLSCMFHMMNEARIGVGSSAVALGYAGYRSSLNYAKTRHQGRPLERVDLTSAEVAIIDHPDVRRMLLAQKAFVEGGLALVLFCARLVDEEKSANSLEARAQAQSLLGLLTPIAKSWPSQWCLKANDLAIQVLGGYGYTRDFPVEQFYRDNRLNPIHEGTHGIQAIDLLDRKVRRAGGADLEVLASRMSLTVERARSLGGEAKLHGDALEQRITDLLRVTEQVWADGQRPEALANASYYLEAFGHVVVAWLWLEQEIVAADRDEPFYRGKRSAAHYFFTYELPTVDHALAVVAAKDRTTIDLDVRTL